MSKRKKRKAKKRLPVGYNAPPGSARARAIRRTAKLYKSGRKQEAFRLRERMEEKERAKKKRKKARKKRKA
mgnify:CR=1 FL=1